MDNWEVAGYKVPRYFSDKELSALYSNPYWRAATQNGDVCPVCLNTNSYRYYGEKYECSDDSFGHPTLRLASLYFLHNIPLQYQQLIWTEWPEDSPERVAMKETARDYIAHFDRFKLNGVGMTVWSKGLGTGKTWAATHVLKELVKLGHDGWWVSFNDVKGYHEHPNAEYYISRMREASVLVLDEIKAPWTEKTALFFSEKLEDLIRPRSNANLPTFLTTNLSQEELEHHYPRVFSLMCAKNLLVPLSGDDVRMGALVWRRQAETAANGEALPIT